MYSVITVPDDASELPEQVGTKFKFWYRDRNNVLTLYKEGRPGTGENWAEKVCAEICEELQIPHAPYELAVWRGRHGVVTPSFVPTESRLVLGNELLGKFAKRYAHTATYKARQHTISLTATVMRHWGMPLGYSAPAGIARAIEVFIGYIMLDALVANQDRHHENWGAIVSSGRAVTLAPTFDHASSLGRNETDHARLRRLTTADRGGDVHAYCERARSSFYADMRVDKPLSTLDAFKEAASFDTSAARYWLGRLEQMKPDQFEIILRNVPPSDITEPAAEFALKMLRINQSRLAELKL